MADNDKPQPDKFRDLARDLDCDEDEAKFEDQVRRISKSKTQKPKGLEPK